MVPKILRESRDEADGDDRLRKPATPQKPSLSASFLEQKRRLMLEQQQPARPHTAADMGNRADKEKEEEEIVPAQR